jgi:Tetracyclin repressor-like, C-terminal domain
VPGAPLPPGEFLAYHFRAGAADEAWLRYLLREALAYDGGPVPHEAERRPVIQAQVDEVRERQRAGVVSSDLDPDLLRLLGFAMVNYPRLLPQVTRMATGSAPGDPGFDERWEQFLRRVGKLFEPAAGAGPAVGSEPAAGSRLRGGGCQGGLAGRQVRTAAVAEDRGEQRAEHDGPRDGGEPSAERADRR